MCAARSPFPRRVFYDLQVKQSHPATVAKSTIRAVDDGEQYYE
jgi:hypothetical protein